MTYSVVFLSLELCYKPSSRSLPLMGEKIGKGKEVGGKNGKEG